MATAEADSDRDQLRPGGQSTAPARLGLVALVLVLVVLGLHGKVSSPVWNNYSKSRDALVAGALEVVVVACLIAIRVRNRSAQLIDSLAGRLRIALVYILGIAAVALAGTILLLLVNPGHSRPSHSATRGSLPSGRLPHIRPAPSKSGSGVHFPFVEVLYGLLAVLLVMAAVALAIKLIRQDRSATAVEPQLFVAEPVAEIQDALDRGRTALLALDDARAAIIACYMAMEESLARAGTARARSETPDELLSRAARTLLISPGAAGKLTDLFYEARFSHPLQRSHRDAAESALAQLDDDLRAAPAPSGAEQ